MKVFSYSLVVVPVIYHIDMFRYPCLPTNLGYWIVDTQCVGQLGSESKATWSLYEIFAKLLIVLVNYLNWSFLASSMYFHGTMVLLVKTYCLTRYIQLAGKQIDSSLKGKREPNAYTSLMFREIEVMCNEYRSLYSYSVISHCIVCMMIFHTLSFYACIKFGLDLPLSMFLFFSSAALNICVVVLCMYTSMANVVRASTFVLKVKLRSAMGNGTMRPSPWFRRYLKSCKILKIYVGNTNFVEPMTPLIVEQFSIQQTASLLLLNK